MSVKHPDYIAIAGHAMLGAQFSTWLKEPDSNAELYQDLYPNAYGSQTPSGWFENIKVESKKCEDLSFPITADDETRRFHPLRGFEFMDPSKEKTRNTPTEGAYRVTVHVPGMVDNPSPELEVFNAIKGLGRDWTCYQLWGEFARAINSQADEMVKERAFRSMRRQEYYTRNKEGFKKLLEVIEKWEDKVNKTDDPTAYYGRGGVTGRDY